MYKNVKENMFFILHLIIHLTVQSRGAPEVRLRVYLMMHLAISIKMHKGVHLRLHLTLFRMGGKKATPTSFSPATSTNVGFDPKTFWLLFLTLLPHWCKISSLYLVPVPNHWIWTKITPQKKRFFWSSPYKIEVTLTFLIEMLQLPNFGHMTTSII